ncbi:MAG: recombinase family protein [Candidatus Methylacidiphilales bacterium]|nr:recombinase family protein [Candidatus Methylacidiphilales bacterium]
MKTNGLRFFIYARKSTDSEDRQVRSIDDQIAELSALTEKDGAKVIKTFIEKQTAKKPGRPIFNDMLARLEAGEADGILAWHPDRLSRNALDGGRIIHMIDQGLIKTLKFCAHHFENTPEGKFMLQIIFGQSKYYVDNLSVNVHRGIRQKLARGMWPQYAPLGYVNDAKTRGLVIDPVRGPFIREMFELYATGKYSLESLSHTMDALGLIGRRGLKLNQANMQYILRNPIYYGLIRYTGELYEGAHEPIITKELFDIVQGRMKRKSKATRVKKKYFAYRGLFQCGECGGLITAEEKWKHQKNGNRHHYVFYHCTKRMKQPCAQRCIREESLTSEVDHTLRQVALPEAVHKWLCEELDRMETESMAAASSSKQRLIEASASCDQKLEKLMSAYLDNVLSLDEYREHKAKLLEEKNDYKVRLKALEGAKGDFWFEPARQTLEASKQAGLRAIEDKNEEKRDFLQKHGSNLFLKDNKLGVSWKNGLELLAVEPFLGELLSPRARSHSPSRFSEHEIHLMRGA